jgi:hypothetical protein
MGQLPPPICFQLTCIQGASYGVNNGNTTFLADFNIVSQQQYFDPPNFNVLFYNCNDIKVGQWIGANIPGYAWKIIEILSVTGDTITLILEDEENYNQNIDSQGYAGSPQAGSSVYIYFELNTHCVIVEIDEYQHNTYEDSCECSRINEIVNGIGGKSVIIIRYNPDIIKNNENKIIIDQYERLNLLVKIIKEELIKVYEKFIVKIIQIFYNDNYEEYQSIKEEVITDKVCI